MAYREYIGSRYVPLLGRKGETSIAWDNDKPYEPLTIVTYMGNSYTSRQYVPAGLGRPDQLPEYWGATGTYDAQVEQYRNEVLTFDSRIRENTETLANIHSSWEYAGTLALNPYITQNYDVQGFYAHARKNETLGLLQMDAELVLDTAADLPGYNALDPENSIPIFTLPEGFRPISNAVMDRGSYCRHGTVGDVSNWYTSFTTFRVNTDGRVFATTAGAVQNANLWGIEYSMFCVPSGEFQ